LLQLLPPLSPTP
jgi:hypothetical protein